MAGIIIQLAPVSLCVLLMSLPQHAAAQQTCDYQVEIKTSCSPVIQPILLPPIRLSQGYGTDGKVGLDIRSAWSRFSNSPAGDFASSDNLDNPGNDFEDCSLDRYTISGSCFNFCSISLTLSATGTLADIGLAWHPDYVKVSGNGITKTFNINRWINANRPLNQGGDTETVHVNQCS